MAFGLPAFFYAQRRGEGAEGAEARGKIVVCKLGGDSWILFAALKALGKRLVSFFFSQRRRGSQRTQRASGGLKACGQLLDSLYFEIFLFKRSEKVTRYLQTSRLPLRLCVLCEMKILPFS